MTKKNICWLCGAEATTKEHIIKRSTIAKLMFNKSTSPIYKILSEKSDSPNKVIKLPGPKSDYLKYKKNLCAPCNNERTQIFDRAYDEFFDFLLRNEQNICATKTIHLKNCLAL